MLSRGLANDEITIGIGTSGYDFAKRLNSEALPQSIETIEFTRERRQRQLACEAISIDAPALLVDDIAVSGKTLLDASRAIKSPAKRIGVGLLFDSKTTRRTIDSPRVDAAVMYQKEGGGNPPINSLVSLQKYPDRLRNLAERYFPENTADLIEAITASSRDL